MTMEVKQYWVKQEILMEMMCWIFYWSKNKQHILFPKRFTGYFVNDEVDEQKLEWLAEPVLQKRL